MKHVLKWSWFITLIALVGCAQLVAPAPTQSPLASPLTTNDLLIRYHRSGGFGGFDDTWIIHADGRVEYVGKAAQSSKQLNPAQLSTLLAAVRASNFTALSESYVGQNTCCDRFMYEITITLDGQTKTVRTIDAADNQPLELTNLLAALNNALK